MRSLYISADIEASGPIPGDYDMISLGLSVVGQEDDPSKCFYIVFKPVTRNSIPEAMKRVGGITFEDMDRDGVDPKEAMQKVAEWVRSVTPRGHRPVQVAWPSSFDFMWTHWYFMHFLGSDPFGHSGVDIRSFAMGRTGLDFEDCGKQALERMGIRSRYPHTHNALDDAKGQGDLFRQIFERGRRIMSAIATSIRGK